VIKSLAFNKSLWESPPTFGLHIGSPSILPLSTFLVSSLLILNADEVTCVVILDFQESIAMLIVEYGSSSGRKDFNCMSK